MLTVILTPMSIGHVANIVKGYALAIGVAFAMWMVWQWWQYRLRERAVEIGARARNLYSGLLRAATLNPELADPALGAMTGPVEVARYKSYVAGLLATADEILILEPTDAWRETLSRQLVTHRSYLASEDFRQSGLRDCTPEVRSLIERMR